MKLSRPELQWLALSRTLLASAALAGLAGCGGDPDAAAVSTPAAGTDATGAASAAAEGAADIDTRFSVEGRGESGKTSTVLEVIEGESVRLSITGADGADNLILIKVAFEKVEDVVGSHQLPIGVVMQDQVFAVGSVDGQAYQSLSGELTLSMTADHHAEGRFDMALGVEDTGVEALTLSGTFESQWMLNCYSWAFAGRHLVSDTPYCNNLTF